MLLRTGLKNWRSALRAPLRVTLMRRAGRKNPSGEREQVPEERQGSAVCLGNFDGVHIGHRLLLEQTALAARQRGLRAVAYTFSEHPSVLLEGERRPLLSLPEERNALIGQLGVQVIEEDFRAVQELSAQEFFERILLGQLRAEILLCGEGHRFGVGAAGDTALLQRLCSAAGVTLLVLPPVKLGGETVSSSRIREAVARGEVEHAARMLGRPFSVTGEVVQGKRLGRTIGVPTINQALPEGRVTPRFGVYAARVELDGVRYVGAANVGLRPTVSGEGVNLETHLVGYKGDLYGRIVTVELLRHLRDERRFPSVEELKRQMEQDVEQACAVVEQAVGQVY